MSPRRLLILLVSAFLLVVFTGCNSRPKQPNVVFILVDDLGWFNLSCNGNPYFETPHIDGLAERGTVFSQAYSSPLCTPTRAALMTGKYPGRLRMTRVGSDYDRGKSDNLEWYHPAMRQKPGDPWDELSVDVKVDLPFEEITMAELARDAGYTTGFIGKWHLGFDEYYPEHHGFDWVFGGDHWTDYFAPWTGHRTQDYEAQTGEYITDRLALEAERFIEENLDDPFFLCLWNYGIHAPIEGKSDLVDHYDQIIPEGEPFHPVYAAMVHSVDECVGRVIKCLQDNGIAENTLIVFMSDNGSILGRPTEDLYDPRYVLNRNTSNDEVELGRLNFEIQQKFRAANGSFQVGFNLGESGFQSSGLEDKQEVLIAEVFTEGQETRKLASRSFTAEELKARRWHYMTLEDPDTTGSYLLKLYQPEGIDQVVIPFASTSNNSIPGSSFLVNGIRVDGNLYLRRIPGTDPLPQGSTLTSSGPFRGKKIMVYEGGVRVPLIFTWPDQIEAGKEIHTPVAHIDMLPTLASFMGTSPAGLVDGVDLHEYILEGTPIADRELYWHYPHYMYSNGAEAIRDGKYKYMEFYVDGRKELYDLEFDPGERNNLLEENPEIASKSFRENSIGGWNRSTHPCPPLPVNNTKRQ
jgi:arylsulfatase A-like enzyme